MEKVTSELVGPVRYDHAEFRSLDAVLTFQTAAAVELLPDAISKHSPLALAIGFAVGTGAMLGLKKVMERFEPEGGGEDHAHLVASEAVSQADGPQGMLVRWVLTCSLMGCSSVSPSSLAKRPACCLRSDSVSRCFR